MTDLLPGPGEIAELTGLQVRRNAQTHNYVLDREPRGIFAKPMPQPAQGPLTAEDVVAGARAMLRLGR
jgi:hypothetical protein